MPQHYYASSGQASKTNPKIRFRDCDAPRKLLQNASIVTFWEHLVGVSHRLSRQVPVD
jgi:hypothetical protein